MQEDLQYVADADKQCAHQFLEEDKPRVEHILAVCAQFRVPAPFTLAVSAGTKDEEVLYLPVDKMHAVLSSNQSIECGVLYDDIKCQTPRYFEGNTRQIGINDLIVTNRVCRRLWAFCMFDHALTEECKLLIEESKIPDQELKRLFLKGCWSDMEALCVSENLNPARFIGEHTVSESNRSRQHIHYDFQMEAANFIFLVLNALHIGFFDYSSLENAGYYAIQLANDLKKTIITAQFWQGVNVFESWFQSPAAPLQWIEKILQYSSDTKIIDHPYNKKIILEYSVTLLNRSLPTDTEQKEQYPNLCMVIDLIKTQETESLPIQKQAVKEKIEARDMRYLARASALADDGKTQRDIAKKIYTEKMESGRSPPTANRIRRIISDSKYQQTYRNQQT